VVNRLYREHVPRSRVALGRRLTVNQNYWKRSRSALDKVAAYAAKRLVEKLA